MAMFGFVTAPEQPYPGCSWAARAPMTYGLRSYAAGDDFDPREHGLVEVQVFALFNSGHLIVKPRTAAPSQPKPTTAPSKQARR
jgi:hypothetical protein